MNELDIGIEAARAAAKVIRAAADGPRQVDHKGRNDLVTEVDLAAENALRQVLGQHTPDIPVLGEEGGGAADATTRWVVDPLDGTTNFVHGFPYYAVSVALEVDGRSDVGVVLDVVRGTAYTAMRGHGAHCDGVPIKVSTRTELGTALVGTGFSYDRHLNADRDLKPFRAFLTRAQGMRRAGAAALDLAMIACGRLDGFWEFTLSRWDVAAGVLLIEEAGGRVSAVDGGKLDRAEPSPLATNGHLHDAMLAVLAEST